MNITKQNMFLLIFAVLCFVSAKVSGDQELLTPGVVTMIFAFTSIFKGKEVKTNGDRRRVA